MDPAVVLQFLITVINLITKYGPDAYDQIVKAWSHEGPITAEDIHALSLMVPPPESYFPPKKGDK